MYVYAGVIFLAAQSCLIRSFHRLLNGRPSFQHLKEALVERSIPLPTSLHGEWFGSGCLKAPWQETMGAKSRFVGGIEHLTRALVRNQRGGQEQCDEHPAYVMFRHSLSNQCMSHHWF